MQRIPEASCLSKKTVDIDILVTSGNGDRKIMQTNRINKQTSLKNREMELVEPVHLQKNRYYSNTYRKNLSWLHFHDEQWVQER